MNKVSVPKVQLPKIDWSKWSFRKFSWMTVLAVMSYFYVLLIIPLIWRKKSTYLGYHVKQGSALFIVWTLFIFSFWIPLLPWVMAVFVLFCIGVGTGNAITGKENPLPLISKLAS